MLHFMTYDLSIQIQIHLYEEWCEIMYEFWWYKIVVNQSDLEPEGL